MKRTQIYIDQPTFQKTKALAKLTGKSVSQVIRQSLKATLSEKLDKKTSLSSILEWSKTIKVPRGIPKNLSSNLDKYLYSSK